VSDTRNKREDALILAKKIRDALLDEEKQVSTLLLGCKTVCRYLGILEASFRARLVSSLKKIASKDYQSDLVFTFRNYPK